jgi:ribonuclease P protein component
LLTRHTRIDNHETNISTKRAKTSPYPWLPGAHGHKRWQTGDQATSIEGSRQTICINKHSRCQKGENTVPGYGFPRKLRLTEPVQFKAVFNRAEFKVSNRCFLILARRNELQNGRLGLVISKKNLPTAVQRNRIKRLLRNEFRLNQNLLDGLDIVILARSNMSSINNKTIAENMAGLLSDLVRKSRVHVQSCS